MNQETKPQPAETAPDTGGWISGAATTMERGRLARDIRSGREGIIMATPDEPGTQRQFWLRPAGGGIEWTVPREHLQLLGDAGAAE